MTPALRKLEFLAHITASVGWMGAVAAFLALAITGLTSTDPSTIRGVYLAMPPITWSVIVPLAFASLLTGLFLSLGTKWGLVRHYWVLAKLLINSLSIFLLLLHTRIIDAVASAAEKSALSTGELRGQRVQLVVASSVALLALLIAVIFSIYKPRGMTPFQSRDPRSQKDGTGN